MAIDYTKALLHKGVLLALESKLQSLVGDLNTSLTSDPTTAYIVDTGTGRPGVVLSSHVQIGDIVKTWDLPGGGPLRVRVCMPMNAPGFSAARRTQGATTGAGVSTTIHTDIYVYFHGDLWRRNDEDKEARNICLVLATLEDWIRTEFNRDINKKLILPSFEFGQAPSITNTIGSDELRDCVVTTGTDGWYPVLMADNKYLHALHLQHSGTAAV